MLTELPIAVVDKRCSCIFAGGLAKAMQLLVGRGMVSPAEYNDACLRPDGYETEPGAHNVVRHLDPSNEHFSTTFRAALYTAAAVIARSRLLIGLEVV